MSDLCCKCGLYPKRSSTDSYCRRCRNEYVRLWKARKRHGWSLVGYNPTGEQYRSPKRDKVRGSPHWWGKEAEKKK